MKIHLSSSPPSASLSPSLQSVFVGSSARRTGPGGFPRAVHDTACFQRHKQEAK